MVEHDERKAQARADSKSSVHRSWQRFLRLMSDLCLIHPLMSSCMGRTAVCLAALHSAVNRARRSDARVDPTDWSTALAAGTAAHSVNARASRGGGGATSRFLYVLMMLTNWMQNTWRKREKKQGEKQRGDRGRTAAVQVMERDGRGQSNYDMK